jgi:hypothetical protein
MLVVSEIHPELTAVFELSKEHKLVSQVKNFGKPVGRFPKAWATCHFTSKIHDKSKGPHLGNLQFLAGKPTKNQKPSHAGSERSAT